MLEIVFQDDYFVAVNKPAGMLVHRSWLDKHETQFVMQTPRDQIGQHVFPPDHPRYNSARYLQNFHQN